MKLSISILNYNTKEQTAACIASVINHYKTELENNIMEIIIVDNGSTDGSFAYLTKRFNQEYITFIVSKENLGFGKGHNLAVTKAKGEIDLFLNSDALLKDKGFLPMVNFLAEHDDIAILGGKLEDTNEIVQKSAGFFPSLFTTLLMLLGLERFGIMRFSPKKIQQVDWVMGASMMVKNDIFEEVGGFNKDLFMYMEDVELCYRVKQKGYKTYFYPEIKIIHKEHGSSNRTFAIVHIYKGLLYFFKTYKPAWQYQCIKILLFLKAKILYTIGKLTNKIYLIETYGQALKTV